MEERRICRKCLTRDMDQTAYFENLHTYIANLEKEIKVDDIFSEFNVCVTDKELEEAFKIH